MADQSAYLLLFQSNPQPMWVYDRATLCFLAVNDAAVRQYGYSRAEFLTMTIADIRPPEDVGALHRVLAEPSDDQGKKPSLWRHLTKARALLDVEILSHSLPFDRKDGVLVVITDVTARMVAERALALEHERLVNAQAVTHVGSWETNLATLEVYWSDETYRIFGLEPGTMMPTHWSFLNFVHPGDRDLVAMEFQGAFNDRDIHTIEHRICLGDGTVKVVEERWQTFVDPEGVPTRAIGTCQDITERKSLEAQFLRAQRLESLGTLAGGIAHDLNNILTPILASIDLLREGEQNPDRIDTLDTIRGSARRGAAMIQQVLTFARGDEGSRVPIDPRTLTRELEAIIKDTFPKGIRFSITAPEELWTVTGDPTQLQQVLLNLCVNAREAMPAGGRLTITLANITVDHAYASLHQEAAPGEYVMFRVSDTGVGIPPEAQDRLFEPFFTTKEIGKGTGLGLSTVHSIVRAHHGFVEFHSELGKGTTFKVHLPANAVARPSANPTLDPSLPHGEGELILVVDDEPGIRSIVQRTLERFGYRVIVAADGNEGIALYAQRRGEIAAVLTDMAMPLMDGPTMMAELRALDPSARIIGSSGLTSEESIAKARRAGVATFISKPYTTEDLLTTLRTILHPEG